MSSDALLADAFATAPAAAAAMAQTKAGDIAIRVREVSKHYLMFDRPEDRLKQMVVPRLQRLAGRAPRCYFRNFAALDGVSFEVRRGETVGIVGRNGSGKSTLLQIVCGTLQPSFGSVEVTGRIAALLELGAGFNPEFTGRENVYLNAAILGLTRGETDARFDDIARFADIGAFIDQPVKTYSSGMYVRLAFAVAINVDPDILVVDEALSVGDEAFQRKCYARIEDIRDKGGTILFVTHGAQTVVQLCDRAMLFDRGQMILEGRPKTVVSQYQRLANASTEGAAAIRAQILAMRDAPAEPAAATPAPRKVDPAFDATGQDFPETTIASPAEAALAQPAEEEGLADYFDPNLVSQSMVALEERGAKIRDVRITTLHGDPVNVLRMGKRYVFEYRVDFSVDARDVGVGMWIRTVEGLGLAGVQTINSRYRRTPRVSAGQSMQVEIEFSCVTLPGTYFVNCGVYGTVGEDQIVMHRLIDVVAWRTAAEADLIAGGRVDLSAMPRISLISPNGMNA
jgi:lipopolysaccharide transport system ATP-binding protein